MHALSVKELKKTYHRVEAVKGISFEIGEREIFALLGPNGAGKSTTLKIVATLLSPTSGKAEVYGYDVVKQAAEVRRIISYLPEEAGAYKNLSGKEYLAFMAAMYTDDAKEQKKFADFGSEITGLKDRLKDKIKTYSKGMTRKLLLARTIMSRPKLTILDEPTSGLDVINGMEVRRMIRSLAGEGMAVLLSSHNMLEIEFLSDRVGILEKGAMREIGAPRELKEKYRAANLEEVFMTLPR